MMNNSLADPIRIWPIAACLLLIPALCFCQPKYEFRAAWVATVENIDWPNKKGQSVDSQKVQFTRLLDMHKRNGLNAVVVQIRPCTDAFYPSQYEPWSEWLTGTQGLPPSPYYDPLRFMIDETHKRGMEFHAWCNPYRAVFSIGRSSIAPTHITKLHPDWFVPYGGTLYFDPGNKEVQQYVTEVIRDIVHRYDIDAIHFDDYFYPYRIPGKEFPDDTSYRQYGNGLSKEDWRRSNVDSIILQLSKTIKEENKYCKFGISPFCVWRNKSKDADGSDTEAGQTNYDDLFANILLWLKNGWIDYVAPQLYLEIGYKRADYPVLLDWWSRHTYGRQCYIGLAIYRAGSNMAWRDKTQLTRQIQDLRNYPQVEGEIYFSSKSFERNPNGWSDSLQKNYYKYPALIPPMPWIDTARPAEPLVHTEYNKNDSSLNSWLTKGDSGDNLRGFAIYRSETAELNIDSTNAFQFIAYDPVADFRLPGDTPGKKFYYFATSISKTNMESKPVPIGWNPLASGPIPVDSR
jgi:uncharacterized lipoprotein YddW (UPF0748 family)